MRCPKCDGEMATIDCENVTVDRCNECHGLWFDRGEAEQLSQRWIAEFIDIGDSAIGVMHDDFDTIPCPRCGETMKRIFEIETAHLQFEQCDEHGKFFDAGEFTLWAESQYL